MTISHYFVQACALNLFCILGVICNLFSVTIFLIHTPLRRRSFTAFQVTLTVFDTLVLVTAWPTLGLNPMLHNGRINRFDRWALASYISYISMNFAMSGCILTSMVATYERFCAICHPMRNLLVDTNRRSKILITVLVFLSVAVNLARIFDLDLVPNPYPRNATVFLKVSDLRFNVAYSIIVRLILEALFTYSVPIVATSVIGILMVVALWRHDSVLKEPDDLKLNGASATTTNPTQYLAVQLENCEIRSVRASMPNLNVITTDSTRSTRNQGQAAAKRDRRKSVALVIVQICKFVITFTFPVISNVIETYRLIMGRTRPGNNGPFGQLEVVAISIVNIGNILIILHSSTNFILYFAFCREFRSKCVDIFRRPSQFRFEETQLLEQNVNRNTRFYSHQCFSSLNK